MDGNRPKGAFVGGFLWRKEILASDSRGSDGAAGITRIYRALSLRCQTAQVDGDLVAVDNNRDFDRYGSAGCLWIFVEKR